MKLINAFGYPISPYMVMQSLVSLERVGPVNHCEDGAEWYFPPEQVVSLGNHGVSVTVANDSRLPLSQRTVFGIPLMVDRSVPAGTIELRQGGKTVLRIENIAIPSSLA